MLDGNGLIVFPNEYSFSGGGCGHDSVGFLCQNILENRCGVSKERVHGVCCRVNLVMRFFKTEGGGYNITVGRCSYNKIIRLGSCQYLFLGFTISFPRGICNWFLCRMTNNRTYTDYNNLHAGVRHY